MRAVLGAVIGAAILAAGATAGVASAPRIRVPDTTPFTVRGTGFQARERVVVTLVSGKTHKRTAVVSPAGAFTVTFSSVDVGACDPYVVRAIGAMGSKATLRRAVQDQCGVQPTP